MNPTQVAGVLFAVHPVHVEAVAGIVSRADLLSCVFFIIALIIQLIALRQQRLVTRCALRSVVYLLVTMSTLSKEVGFTALTAIVLSEALWRPDKSPRQQPRQVRVNVDAFSEEKGAVIPRMMTEMQKVLTQAVQEMLRSLLWIWDGLTSKETLYCIAFAFVYALVFMKVRLSVHSGAPLYQWCIMENQIAVMPPGITRTLTIAYSHVMYLWLLIWPADLAFDHGFAAITPVRDLFDPRVASIALAYAIVAGTVAGTWLQRHAARFWCVCTALATFIPAANVFIFVGTEVAERLLYVPTVTLFILVASFLPRSLPLVRLHALCKDTTLPTAPNTKGDPKGKQTLATTTTTMHLCLRNVLCACALAVVLGSGAVRSWRRNADWHSEFRLYESGMEVHPTSIKALNNLGNLLMNKYSHESNRKAEYVLLKAIELFPDHAPAYFNLGLVYKQRRGGWAKAVRNFYKSIYADFRTPPGAYSEFGQLTLDVHLADPTSRELPAWFVEAGGPMHRRFLAENQHNFLNTVSQRRRDGKMSFFRALTASNHANAGCRPMLSVWCSLL